MNGFNRRWISLLLHKAEMQQVQRPLTRFKWLNLSAHARQLPKDTSENYMGILNFRPFFFSVQYLGISMPLIKTLQQDFSLFFYLTQGNRSNWKQVGCMTCNRCPKLKTNKKVSALQSKSSSCDFWFIPCRKSESLQAEVNPWEVAMKGTIISCLSQLD